MNTHLITNKNNISFCFIISSFNNSANIEKNLNSVIFQSYKNWRVIYTNDCSTDTTHTLFYDIIKKNNVCHFMKKEI
jgi:glycosyltransferase involved in cell wall biosynthesis